MSSAVAPTAKRWHRNRNSAPVPQASQVPDDACGAGCSMAADDNCGSAPSVGSASALESSACHTGLGGSIVDVVEDVCTPPKHALCMSSDVCDSRLASTTPEVGRSLEISACDAALHSVKASPDPVHETPHEVLQRDRHRWRRKEVQPCNAVVAAGARPLSAPSLASSTLCNVSAASSDGDEVSRALEGMFQKSKLSLSGPARLLQAPHLARDFASVLEGGAHHLKNIFGSGSDRKLFEQLRREIGDSGLWRSRGGRRDDGYEMTIAPEGGQRTTGRITGEDALTLAKLPAHRYVLEHLAGLFDTKPLSWWINLYPSGRDAKNFHKDNFGQNITIGASFGATRNLTFRHGESRDEFHFPQENGDVFAFREHVNSTFLHGMHPLKSNELDPGPRISVIMMGRARRQS